MGIFFENYKFYMAYFGLIKLESSNLLDITIIDGYIHITNLLLFYISQIYKIWRILLAVK